MHNTTALLIIDVQLGAFDGIKIPPVYDGPQLLSNINKLLQHARKTQMPVIYIQDCGKKGGAFEKGTKHWQIHPEIAPLEQDIVIEKSNTSNAFEGTSLMSTLSELNVDEIIACGLHSEYCFASTCKAAIAKSLRVTVVADGHSTCSSHEDPKSRIEKQNQLLADIGATVKSASETLCS